MRNFANCNSCSIIDFGMKFAIGGFSSMRNKNNEFFMAKLLVDSTLKENNYQKIAQNERQLSLYTIELDLLVLAALTKAFGCYF